MEDHHQDGGTGLIQFTFSDSHS